MKDLYLCSRFIPDHGDDGYPEDSRINIVMRSIITVEKSYRYYKCSTVGEATMAILKGEEIVKLKRLSL